MLTGGLRVDETKPNRGFLGVSWNCRAEKDEKDENDGKDGWRLNETDG